MGRVDAESQEKTRATREAKERGVWVGQGKEVETRVAVSSGIIGASPAAGPAALCRTPDKSVSPSGC